MEKKSNIKIIEYLLIFSLSIIFTLIFSSYQAQIIAGNGYGWDGLEYQKIFKIFNEGIATKIDYPYCNRLASAFLSNLTGISDPHLAFKYTNTIFSIIYSIVIYSIARLAGFNIYYSAFSFLLTIIPFFSPVRFIPFYPVYTDPPFLAILALAFLMLILRRFGISFILIVFLYLFREAAIYILPFFIFSALYLGGINKKIMYRCIAALLSILVLKLLISKYMNCNGSQLYTAIGWIYRRLSDPNGFLSYCAAISMTAAPIIYAGKCNELSKVEWISIIGLLFSGLLSFVGGSDSTRIFYSFFPLYFIAIIYSIRRLGYIFSIFCFMGYLITNRFGTLILEPLNYQPSRDESGFFWQFPDHARPEVSLIIITTWIILFFTYERLFLLNKSPKIYQNIN